MGNHVVSTTYTFELAVVLVDNQQVDHLHQVHNSNTTLEWLPHLCVKNDARAPTNLDDSFLNTLQLITACERSTETQTWLENSGPKNIVTEEMQ